MRALVIILALIPLLIPLVAPKSILFTIGLLFLFVVYVVTWDLVAGYVGEVNLGHVVFVGIGAYTSVLLTLNGLNMWLSILVGGMLSTLFGLAIGSVCLRLRGYYLALVTAILPLVFIQIVNIYPNIFGGYEGLSVGINNALHRTVEGRFYISYLFTLASLIVIYKIVNSKFGLRLKAIRDDPDLAESLGIDVFKHKVLAFVISAFFSGIAGGITAFYRLSVGVDLFGISLMLLIIISAILGGLGTYYGAIIGAVIVYVLKYMVLTSFAQSLGMAGVDDLILYALLIVLIYKLPKGIFGTFYKS